MYVQSQFLNKKLQIITINNEYVYFNLNPKKKKTQSDVCVSISTGKIQTKQQSDV
jgi:CDP-diacylglycerol pyrophosphatase